ncbi:uncharacterized protein LOC104884449 [Beta vulgaris subsp. vulgaris]|uniref:uncharacterized protein LOC104884449 n=1 Tax=Beta vulgaris subsp. vulgaris TaxID=3555 RepID=UPI00254772C4|nr:uncharacterized protein LOC104884449 [Beta vulgaris subsp. vulgaris]
MNILSLNCRGLNSSDTPIIPYIHWLLATVKPMFLFLQETKCSLTHVQSLLRSTKPRTVVGVDALGSSGGLVVVSWAPFAVDVLSSMCNYVFCKISANNEMIWYVLFLYGESRQESRPLLWDQLLHLLAPYPDFLIIGDINQLDHYGDKLGGATIIRGWEEFTNWKHTLELQDIPFVGPRFTWTNNRDAIFYQTEPPSQVHRRPYQFENWCLIHPDLPNIISSVWRIPIAGSTMYRFTKHLSIFRTQIRRWCLDHKVVWGIDWQELSTKLAANATHISTLPQDKYVQMGELPTKFFYNKMRQKQRSAYIYLLWTADEQWTEDGPTIVNTILHYFKVAYGPSRVSNASDQVQDEAIDLVLRDLNLPHLSLSQQQQLLRPFSKDEVHEAMFSIGQGKSPGLESSTAEFFKHHWVSLGNEVFQAVNHFFTTGFILHEWNQTLIVLLPKGQNPEDVTQFRPISLCNTIYKCVSKCLVNRLRPLLCDLITEYQSAFIPGRHMDDNILISHELTHVLNKRRRGNVHLAALKIDMNKAYDRINWRFLLKVLQAYGFPAQWIQLISQCIFTVTYRILVNGQVTESFPSHCGLRQGDPLSPYLFLFCMDIFSRMLIMAMDIRLFDGFRAHRYAPSISHLFFADDALLFFKASITSCTKLSNLLARFYHISGQMLSLRKSFVKFSPNVSEHMGQEYKRILQLMLKSPWAHILELLHLQKGAGGLGLRSIAVHNRSLLIKKVWRIHRNSNVLISKVFSGQTLGPGSSIATLRSMRSQCSWGARGLIQAEKVLLTNYVWKIGSNSRLLAGKERWVHRKIPLFRDNVSLRTAATVSIASLLLPQQQGWNVSRLHSLFHSSTVRDIRALEVPRLTNQADISIWPFTTSGQYITKSGYYFLSRHTDIYSMNPPLNSDFFRILWGLRIMPKWKLFLRKLFHNGLATTANLAYRGLAISDGCPSWSESQGQRHSATLHLLATPFPQPSSLREALGPPGFFFAHFGISFCGVPQLHIQVDGSWKKSSPLAGIAWGIDHVTTNAREGQGNCIYAESALVAEARACLGALIWAQARGYRQILIYTDSEVLVWSLLHQVTQPISIAWTLNDIRYLGQQLQWCRIIKANRQQVQKAHELANHVRLGHIPMATL